VSVLLAMLALLLTVGTPVLTSGSTTVSTILIVSFVAAASTPGGASDCRMLDVLIGVVWLHAAQHIIKLHRLPSSDNML